MSDPYDALRDAAEPSEIAVARVIRRAERTLDTRRRKAPYFLAVLGGAALAALVTIRASAPAPVPLVAETPTELAVGADVGLRYTGQGELDGTRIRWDAGALDVEVTPERGVNLAVETPEGTATVVGTGFTVTRDALGTRVDVRHGVVAVRCNDGREARLGAGQSLVCLPVRAGGMLGRARALDAGGADPAQVLDALEAGLRLDPDGGPMRAELAARRIRTLVRMGRDDEAAAAAAAWLAGGEALRRDEVRGLAIGLSLRRGDCAAARTFAAPDDGASAGLDAATTAALFACP